MPSTLTRLVATASKSSSYAQNNICFGYVDVNVNTRELGEPGQFHHTVWFRNTRTWRLIKTNRWVLCWANSSGPNEPQSARAAEEEGQLTGEAEAGSSLPLVHIYTRLRDWGGTLSASLLTCIRTERNTRREWALTGLQHSAYHLWPPKTPVTPPKAAEGIRFQLIYVNKSS